MTVEEICFDFESEQFIGLSNIYEVFNEISDIEGKSASTNSPDYVKVFSKYISGVLFKLHYDYHLSFEGMDYIRNALFEHCESFNDLKRVCLHYFDLKQIWCKCAWGFSPSPDVRRTNGGI